MSSYDKKTEKNVPLAPEEWSFFWKDPSDCGSCVRAQKLFDKVFGDRKKFYQTPVVNYTGDRCRKFDMMILSYFAKHGEEKTKEYLLQLEQEELKKQEKIQKKNWLLNRMDDGKRLKKRIGTDITTEAKRWVLDIMDDKNIQSIKLVNSDVVICHTERSEWGNSGGIGYFDQIRVYYYGQSEMQEWQWRDRWSASNDKPYLSINGIGAVELDEQEDKINVKIELKNREHGNRRVTFEFDPVKEMGKEKSLSNKDQAKFSQLIEREIDKIMKRLMELWECKPTMIADYGAPGQVINMPRGTPTYVKYQKPSVKQKVVKKRLGVAAFITEEQIDHRVNDPQMRYELHLVRYNNGRSRRLFEDHNEGSALISIIDLDEERVIVNTKNGKREIQI